MPPEQPSDAVPAIGASGEGDVVGSVVSMSARHPDGEDAAYLEWHVLDHLPEQHRLVGLRRGERWVSTPACRTARAASVAPFDAVDHLVQYLFAEPVGPALDRFFPLGGALREAGRMPMVLPRVQVGWWELAGRAASPQVLVGAAVVPWRPSTGAYVLVEQTAASLGAQAAELVAVPGVAGAWTWSGAEAPHDRLESTAGHALTICYLDAPPVDVASGLAPVLGDRWASGDVVPLLAAPFEAVIPFAWDRSVP